MNTAVTDRDRSVAPSDRLSSRSLLQTTSVLGRETRVWLTSAPFDQSWDDFLQSTDLGQFQQSGLWAQAKQLDGWQCLRLILENEDQVVGGLQLLWRRTRFGRVGYVIKGPVLPDEPEEIASLLLDLFFGIIRKQGFLAIVVQAPDFSRSLSERLVGRGFLPDKLMNVISATCLVKLAGPPGAWEKNMGRSKKVEVRQAARRGAVIREGDLSDVPQFFELMSATCARQQTSPNPSSPEALRHLVQVFRSAQAARLSFAVVEGAPVACALDLKFGNRATVWKKGWSGAHPDKHPNTLLAYESMRWAERNGCSYYDFAGMGRSFAEHLLAQQPLTEEEKKDRDLFHLQFGAEPQLLPEALIYWRRAPLRFLYRMAVQRPWLVARLRSAARRFGSS